MQLEPRSLAILQHCVEAFIEDAQPVSSATLARRIKEPLSSATIRAVMAELETQGYLYQPHTSAGRVPTEKGLRLYVDGLMSPKLRPWDRTRLDAAAASAEPQGFAQSFGQNLAGLSGQVVVIAMPSFLGERFREVGLVRVDARRVVAFFVSPGGLVQQKLVELDFDVSADELQRIQNYLNEHLRELSLDEVRALIDSQLAADQAEKDSLERRAFAIGQRVLPEPSVAVHVEGTTQLVEQPEFADIQKLRGLLRAIDEKAALVRLLDALTGAQGVRVMLGSEHHIREMDSLACVAGACTLPSGRRAAITLLGPTRMDYERLVPLVGYATQLFGRYLERI